MRLAVVLLALVLAPPAGASALDEAGATVDHEGWDWTTVVPGRIGLGGGELTEAQVESLAEEGFRAVLNLREKDSDPADAMAEHGMTYLHVPLGMAELDTFDTDEIEASLAFLREEIAAGRPVYVHCIAGWHRSAAVVAAWFMVEEDLTADEAWERLEALRPSVEPRWIDGLYGYEARRSGVPQLEVDLRVPAMTARDGERIDVEARVTAGGRPFPGATVRFVAEYDDIDVEATTGPDGMAVLPLTMDGSKIQYVSAQARADGIVPGYDRVAVWAETSGRKERAPFEVEVRGPDGPVEAGSPISIDLRAREEDGKPANVRISITDGERTLWRSYLERGGQAVATVQAPEAPGVHVLRVRATTPYTDTQHVDLRVEVEAASAPPDLDPAPLPDPDPAPVTPPSRPPPVVPASPPPGADEPAAPHVRTVPVVAGAFATALVAAAVWAMTRPAPGPRR